MVDESILQSFRGMAFGRAAITLHFESLARLEAGFRPSGFSPCDFGRAILLKNKGNRAVTL
jgi:hypothetical protein